MTAQAKPDSIWTWPFRLLAMTRTAGYRAREWMLELGRWLAALAVFALYLTVVVVVVMPLFATVRDYWAPVYARHIAGTPSKAAPATYERRR